MTSVNASTTPAHPRVGDAVLGRFTKWGGGRHWEWVGRYLGEDQHGHWWWAPAGTRCRRPGVDFVEELPWVSVAPHDGAWVASFYPSQKEVSVYVDMTTVPVWQAVTSTVDGPQWEVTMVDLDLDVVLTREGRLFVDDEEEFEAHRHELGYPPEVVAMAEAAAREVLTAVGAGTEPFGSVGHARLAALTTT